MTVMQVVSLARSHLAQVIVPLRVTALSFSPPWTPPRNTMATASMRIEASTTRMLPSLRKLKGVGNASTGGSIVARPPVDKEKIHKSFQVASPPASAVYAGPGFSVDGGVLARG